MPQRPTNSKDVIAIGLLTQQDLDVLGSAFRRAIALDDISEFEDLLARIDEAEHRGQQRSGA